MEGLSYPRLYPAYHCGSKFPPGEESQTFSPAGKHVWHQPLQMRVCLGGHYFTTLPTARHAFLNLLAWGLMLLPQKALISAGVFSHAQLGHGFVVYLISTFSIFQIPQIFLLYGEQTFLFSQHGCKVILFVYLIKKKF